MMKLIIFCCGLICYAKATELEDQCIVAFLKQRNLLNATTFFNYHLRPRSKSCDQIVKRIVKNSYEENFDYLEEGGGVENKTYRACLKSEFDRHKMDEKFLKSRAFDGDGQKDKLDSIRDDFISKIKFNCSQSLTEDATRRFKDFITDKGGLSSKLTRHPAVLKIKENLVCMNLYAIEKKILDSSIKNIKLKPNNRTEEDCQLAVGDVITLIVDEWHIRRYSEDDKIQRCYIEILLQTNATDLFIKNTLLSQLQLSQDQKNSELEAFLKNSAEVHELAYKCLLNGFEKI